MHIYNSVSLNPRPFLPPVFDHLLYAKTKGSITLQVEMRNGKWEEVTLHFTLQTADILSANVMSKSMSIHALIARSPLP